ncbi:MAG: TetR/AcrR family transcriptional regulator [Deltaproteobacteria bacterium]|nr:TetR/AcrR family transcriptional regulator [Deltaproteobacteria bacterium]
MARGKSEERIDQIIDATIRCIVEKGYENLTMQAISEYSGLSKGAINHYFKRKEDILVAVLKGFDRKLFKLVDDKVRNASDVKDHMRFRLRITFDLAKNDPIFMYLITDFLALAMNNPIHGEGIKKFLKKYRYLASLGLRPGLKEGLYRDVNPESIGAIVLGMIIGIGVQWILAKDDSDFAFDEVAKMIEDMIMLYLEKKD